MGKHERTAEKIKRKPTAKDIKWAELKRYLKSLGFEELQGSGSRVKFVYLKNDGERRLVILHRNHPSPDVGPKTIDSVRSVLQELQLL